MKNRKGEIHIAALCAAIALIGFGHFQYSQGKWGKNGSEAVQLKDNQGNTVKYADQINGR